MPTRPPVLRSPLPNVDATPTDVLIVGAGPTGLVLAIALARRGVPVRIIDRNAEPSTTSRAVAVQARVLEFYQQMGLAAAVVDRGVRADALNLWVGGRRAARVPIGPVGADMTPFPFVLIFPQDAHERLLIDHLETLGVRVERSTTLTGFAQDEHGVHATLEDPRGQKTQCDARYVAGCDGAHSAVRQALGIGFPGATYSKYFYVADVEGSGPTTNGEVNVSIDEADFLIVFPMRGPGRTRLIGVARDDGGADHGDVRFEDVSHIALRELGVTVSHVNWFSTYHVHHRVASRFRDRRAFLLGDAAHIHSPVGGQGMNTGISDAINLAWKLADVLQGRAAARLLDSYEPERIAFARRLVATTDRLFTLVTAEGRLAAFIRARLAPRIASIGSRIGAIRRFMFRTVSQIVIQYRASPLSEGGSGKLRAGDRLPWVRMHDGDNFAPLASLDWQVHVYGEPAHDPAPACSELGISFHRFPWTRAAEGAGLHRGALYLVRPDGYIGFADPGCDPAALRRYCAAWELVPTPLPTFARA
jgi:2-polyprenyl-6-methoxyphenol hydroxylase-like FAD-dependent oxidoreductase